MLRIPCPYCGVRDEPEFTFGGPSHVTRPAFEVTDAVWADYLFSRDNPKGIHYERWGHAYGCGRWFNVARHTVTHEILAVYRMGEGPPVLGADRSGGAKGLDLAEDVDSTGERSAHAS
jgi:heterotetrameric sarcosine oxidase delta subunit